jgi:hypothetical protein
MSRRLRVSVAFPLPAPEERRGEKSHNRICLGKTPMIANTLFATIAFLLAGGFWLLGELKFLIPYRHVLIHQYGSVILLSIVVLFVNLFAGVYAIQRKFFLKDTGRKLSHVDNQALAGHFPLPSPTETEEPE